MVESARLQVRRFPYEEPNIINVEFEVTNGLFGGTTDIYCNAEDLAEIGTALKRFPTSLADEFRYEIGSDAPDDNNYLYFLFRAYVFDEVGHTALQFAIDIRAVEPYGGACRFSIRADAASINRLGEQFEDFSKLENYEFSWTPRLVDT